MTYRLYNRAGSGGMAVEAAFALAGESCEVIELDSRAGTPLPESFREVNPWGQVPALVLPEGSLVTETGAILVHLGDRFAGKGLAPRPGTDQHAEYLRWMFFASVNLYEAVLRRNYPSRYTTDEQGQQAVRAAAIRRMGEAFLLVEEALDPRPFLLGETMSLADLYLAMLASWCRDPEVPRVRAMSALVRDHPAIAPVWQRHFAR